MGESFNKILDQVYSALDNGKYDAALQLCLKPEFAKYALGRALTSYTYVCLKNYAKGMEIARMIAAAQPTDPSVVSTVGCTFKAARAETEFAELYENAMKKGVLPESYILELFSCYCRQFSPKQMQFIAQKLHKTAPDRHEYVLWSVACMLLQDLPPTMMVLAEKMAQKVLYDLAKDQQPGAEELGLYTYILVKQGKLAQAYDELLTLRKRKHGVVLADETHFHRNPHYVKMSDLQFSVHKADLLIRQGRLAEVVTEAKEVLKAFPDQWNMHQVMVDCLFAAEGAAAGAAALSAERLGEFPVQDLSALLKTAQGTPAEAQAEVTAAQVVAVLQHQAYLLQLQAQHPKLRGPYLAELYLLAAWTYRLQSRRSDAAVAQAAGSTQGLWQVPATSDIALAVSGKGGRAGSAVDQALAAVVRELGSLIARYATRFHSKQCCFSDLKPYVLALWERDSAPGGDGQGVVAALRAWAVTQRGQADDRLVSALQALVAESQERQETSAKAREAAAAALPPVPTSSDKAEVGADAEGADEGDEEGEVAEGKEEEAAAGTGAAGGKKKKRNKKKKKAASSAAAATDGKVDESATAPVKNDLALRVNGEYTEVLLPLCAYCKFDQIASFCDTLLLSAPSTPAQRPEEEEDGEMAQRAAMYGAMREVYAKGLGEEPRTLQPGDELLLQNSSLLRRRFFTARSAAVAATEASALAQAVRWLRCLLRGSAASPYSSAFRLDLLEAFRALGLGEAAATAYSEIKPRHIQHDSMSYLALPTLMETGQFNEAVKEMRAILHFHASARRDTAEMAAKAFQFANYMQVMQLSKFADDCKRSLALVLAKAELPILELVTKHASSASALAYINDYLDNKTSESLELQDEAQLAALVDHADLALQVRTDQLGAAALDGEARVYRRQMVNRLAVAQQTHRMLSCALSKDGEGALQHFERRLALLAGSVESSDPHLPWDQRLSPGSGAVAIALRNASDKALRFVLGAIATSPAAIATPPSSSSSAGAAAAAGFATAAETASSAMEAATALYELRQALAHASPYLLPGREQLLSPEWVRGVVAFVRTLGMELSLAIQAVATLHGHTTPSGYKQTGGGGSLEEYHIAIRSLQCPPLGGAEFLHRSVEVVSDLFLGITEGLRSQMEGIATKLDPSALDACRDSLYALLGEQPTCDAAPGALQEGGPLESYEAARRSLAAANAPTSAPAPVAAEVSLASLSLNESGPTLSRDLSDPARLQTLAALQVLSSHRDLSTRLAAILKERAAALRDVLKW